MRKSFLIVFLLWIVAPGSVRSQGTANYDESKVPDYVLPDVLQCINGQKVTTRSDWVNHRRPEVLALFEEYVYGKVPAQLKLSSYKVVEKSQDALGGKAIRKQVALRFKKNKKELEAGLLLYLPKGKKKSPVFLGYNFNGNHSVADDPEIIVSRSWARDNPSYGIINNQFTEQSRGVESERWVVEKIIDAGFGIATMYYGDIDPDKDDFSDGIQPLLYGKKQTEPAPDEWGSISAWAWGLSRAMDYLQKDKDVDASRVAVIGHSRLGKTALWAGALDQRFAMVISNNSGCGGAALSRRAFGETVARINRSFPYWFCKNFRQYNYRENLLPVDQHMLIALIAPRPVYVASASEDLWSDPKGEYLSAYYASPVYRLFGEDGLADINMPEVNHPVMGHIAYHIREGKHNITAYDWDQYIRFAQKYLK